MEHRFHVLVLLVIRVTSKQTTSIKLASVRQQHMARRVW
jgi:hypothetical protein